MTRRRFASVPPPGASPEGLRRTVEALQAGFAYVTAQTQPAIKPLADGATLAEATAKINEVIARLQGTAP